jgi:hypothetical protein
MSIALLGSWDIRWIKDHQSWLENYGPHFDAWTNRIKKENRNRLYTHLKLHESINFYAYLAKSRNGNGQVGYVVTCSEMSYFEEPITFNHEHGNHFDHLEYQARLRFRIVNIAQLFPTILLNDFETVSGKQIGHPRVLQNLLFVEEPTMKKMQKTRG